MLRMNEVEYVETVAGVGFVMMVAGGVTFSPITGYRVAAAKVCIIKFRSIFFTTRFNTSVNLIDPPTMSSRRTKKTLTPKEEENGRRRLMALQMDDFDPRRVEKSRTADDEEKLVHVEEKKQLEGVKAWGCKSLFPFYSGKLMCLSYLIALAPVTERVADKRSTKEAQGLKTIMTMEDNASNSKRIEIVSTTDSHVNPPFIYWKSVRLRHIDNVNEEGLPSEKVDAVMVRRRKCVLFFKQRLCSLFFCSSYC